MQHSLIGEQLGNYRLSSLLGRGGFAEVYLGEHTRLSSKAAIKVLHAYLPPEEIEHFQREAQIIAMLKHPHIVRVLDFDVHKGIPFLVMEYYPEGTVRHLYPKGAILPLETIAAYARQVADALQYAHDQKLIHRDIKPENMLIGGQGEIALSDFGIATASHSTSSMSRQAPIGTIAYMAPEQIQSQARPASDQYALAVAVYEWLYGRRPFEGTYAEIIAKHLSVPVPSLCQQYGVAPAIEQVILTALAKDPRQRYPTVQDFALALATAIQRSPLRSRPATSAIDSTALPDNPMPSSGQVQSLAPTQLAPSADPYRSSGFATTVAAGPRTDPPAHHPPTSTAPEYPPPPSFPVFPTASSSQKKRKTYSGIIAGIIVLFLLIVLIPAGIQITNHYTQRVNATATTIAAATSGARSDTATAASDQATASAQQTARAVTATAFVYATATAAVRNRPPRYFAGTGKLFYDEPLDTVGDYWTNNSDSHGDSCQFTNHAYYITETIPGGRYICSDLNEVSGGNELVEVEMMMVKGDCASLNIRFRVHLDLTYPFRVCQNGSAMIADHKNGGDIILGSVAPGTFALKGGWNTIGFEANVNNTLMGYVNGQRVLTVQDDGLKRIGNFGVAADSIGSVTEVAFRNLRAWMA